MGSLFTNLLQKVVISRKWTENGPMLDREWTDEVAEKSVQMSAVWAMMWVKLVNLVNFVMPFLKWTKWTKWTAQIFVESAESAKSARSIFATFATFASANFVGKASCESTVRYREWSRISLIKPLLNPYLTLTRFRLSLGSNLSRFSLASLICLCMLTVGVGNVWGAPSTVSVTISTYATAHSWKGSGGGPYTSVSIDANVTASVYNGGSYSGKYYSDWRFYQSESSGVTISTSSGTISSVTFTYENSNGGRLYIGSTGYTTGTAISLSNVTSQTFTVGSSTGKTNGQVKITAISVTYVSSGGSTPTITTSSSMTTFSCNMSTGIPVKQSFSVSGTALTNNVTITPPSGYEVCLTENGTYTSSIELSKGSGTLSSTTIYVKLKDDNAAGSYSGNISCVSSGATTKNVAVSGSTPFKVTWKANGSTVTTTYVTYASGTGTALGTLPSDPDPEDYSCDGKAFYGWFDGVSYSHASTPPSIISTSTKITTDKTFIAVFADADDSSVTKTQDSFTATSASSINSDTNLSYSTAQGGGTSTPFVTNNTIRLYQKDSGKSFGGYITISSSGGNISSITIGSAQATSVKYSTGTPSSGPISPASDQAIEEDRTYTVNNLNTSSITFYCMGTSKTSRLEVNYLSVTYGSTTYSNYATTCCTPLGSINGSVSWSNPTQAVVTWDKLDDQVSAWALSWSPNTAGSSITSAIADYGLTQKTATVSGLACGTEYTFTLTPTIKSGVCTPASNPTIESTSTKYSITKASVSEGSFTTKISSDAVTSACNGSTISIAATPSTGYTFSSWMITNDDNSDADVTSTLLGGNSTTSPTSFTMPSHRVTITPSFSCIEPEIGKDPASASYTEGASPSALTVEATLSSGTLTYKWQKSTNSGVSWTDESGTGYNTATYAAANISTSLSANGVQYRCIVGNSEGGCTVTSGVATITVTAASQCVAPTFSVAAGTYNSAQTVTISSTTPGSTIYYTTNGDEPTTGSSHGTEGEASASVTVSSSLTLKAIAYKGGMTNSDVSDATYVICSTDPSFSTTSSSNITITGARVTCAGITKGTCDIDAYGIVYGTSEHPTGNAQQKGTDASTNVSSYYVDLTGLTAATTYYARPYATVNGKTVYGTEISFTTLHIPVISVSETAKAFGTKKVDGFYEMSFAVSGEYLQGNIGLAISGTNEAMFSVDKTSLTPSTGTVGNTTVTVTYTPSGAGSHSATVSITSTNATTKTVTLSGTGQYEDTYMTAMHEGVTAWTSYAAGVTKAGTGYDVPNPGDIAAGDREGTGCEGIHYHFAGWVEETYKASPSGHIVAASGTKDASNKTFWAVWEKETAGSVDGYLLVEDHTILSAGDKILIANAKATSASVLGCQRTDNSANQTNRGCVSSVTITSKVMNPSIASSNSETTKAFEIELQGTSSGWYFYDVANGGYLQADGGTSTNKLTYHTGSDHDNHDTWTISVNNETGVATIMTLAGTTSSNKGWMRWNSNSSLFSCYNSGQNNIYVFKYAKEYEDPKVECICSADPVAGTAAVDAEGTFSASSIAVKATGASTGHADCSYTDYGFVWSSSVTTPTLVEGTGAASTNCTKVPVGNDGQATTFAGSISGSFTANNPIYVRSYVKNGKAEGTYQYSDVVTVTPRSVTFNLNGHGSSTPVAQFVNNGSKATDPSYTESVTGYIFGSWYKEVGCTNQWNFATDVVSGESKTLYAKWTPISYEVRFNDNYENYLGTATGSMSDQSFDYDESKALTANGFSLAGYDFAGWALTADGDVAHLDEAEVENLSSTDDAVVDLYAIWSPKSYDVTLAATDETSSVGEQVVTATYNAAMPTVKKGGGAVAAPSRTGYTFTGWEYSSTTYYNYNAGTSTLSSAHVWDQPNSTTTLTPKWSTITYTITYNLNSGTNPGSVPTEYTIESSDVTLPTPTRSGYNFDGWYADSDLSTGGVHTTIANGSTGNKEYWAKWTAKTLTSISITPSSGEVYVGQYVDLTVSYDPADYLSQGYTLDATPVYVTKESAAPANTKLRLKGGRGSGPGASITETVTETVTIKASGDNTKKASVEMTVNPLPRVHFVDNIHNETFSDVVATIDENTLNPDKSTPTHADVAEPGEGNSCEKTHLHLIGWIRSDYSKVANYMAGTGDAPTTDELRNAGTGYWFLPDAAINVETYNGKTFYAVWAVEE